MTSFLPVSTTASGGEEGLKKRSARSDVEYEDFEDDEEDGAAGVAGVNNLDKAMT